MLEYNIEYMISTWVITCVACICQEYCTYEYIAVFAGGDAGVHDGGRG